MMKKSILSTVVFLASVLAAPAAEVWAPGGSQEEGWYDYHKSGSNDGIMADTAMC